MRLCDCSATWPSAGFDLEELSRLVPLEAVSQAVAGYGRGEKRARALSAALVPPGDVHVPAMTAPQAAGQRYLALAGEPIS